MQHDETWEAELEELMKRMDGIVPRAGAHLSVPEGGDARTIVGNRHGYLRLGLELMKAALHPLPPASEEPPRIAPDLGYLLSRGSSSPFELCEVDESIVSRPPVVTGLGGIGQLAAGVLVVAVAILVLIGGAVVWRWLFG